MGLSVLSVDILDTVATFLIILVYTIIMYHLYRSFQQFNKSNNSSSISKWIIVSVAAYFILNIIYSTSEIIAYLSKYMKDKGSNSQIIEHMYNAAGIVCGITNFLYDMSFVLFLKIKLQNTYKDTFLKVNKLFMNISLFIFFISAIIFKIGEATFYGLSYIYPSLQRTDVYINYNDGATLQYFIISVFYLLLILIIFNRKLYKFISTSIKTDSRLTLQANALLKNAITKQ
eukprot:223977_1